MQVRSFFFSFTIMTLTGQGKDLSEYFSDEKQRTGRRHFYCESVTDASKQELAERIRKHMEQYERKEPWLEQSPRPDDIEP